MIRAALAATLLLGAAQPVRSPDLPLRQVAGPFRSGHVQGIAVDVRGGYIYYSFTNLLAKYSFDGRLVATLSGWTGHLGDLDFNAADGKVYGSLEYKAQRAFYIAVIDVARLDRVGMTASGPDVLRTVYLPEVVADYTADLDGDGVVADSAASPDHRYGCSGIDGVGFGPAFGRVDGPARLTVAYGIYGATGRDDNDHQVLLQYDVSQWDRLAQPLSEAAPHRAGPERPAGKYFVRTGNTRYGVQTLAYDPASQRWYMGVYRGSKPAFPNYTLFAVDARVPPRRGDLIGVRGADGAGWEQGSLLTLADAGLRHPTGVRGWMGKADVGLQPLGDGTVYRAENTADASGQRAVLVRMRWMDNSAAPFQPAK